MEQKVRIAALTSGHKAKRPYKSHEYLVQQIYIRIVNSEKVKNFNIYLCNIFSELWAR